MLAVSTTRWSPTLATLLLVMSTTLQPFLLPTVQASVVSGTVRQMWRPSMDSISFITNRHRALVQLSVTGLLGKGSSDFSPDAEMCLNSIAPNPQKAECLQYQSIWLILVNRTHQSNANYEHEYLCKAFDTSAYCANLVASTFCRPNEYAALHNDLKQMFVDDSILCNPWKSWESSLESPPPITNESIKCDGTIPKDDPTCDKEAQDYRASLVKEGITDETELTCKTFFEGQKCTTRIACQYCTESAAKEYLNFTANVWTPAQVECNKWASDKPIIECPVTTSLPAKTSSSSASVCESMVLEKSEECKVDATKKYPNPDNANAEKSCRGAYYYVDCTLEAACKYCTGSETKDGFDEMRKVLDEIRDGCKQWSSDEPKLECISSSSTSTTSSSSNTMMIVGIIIGVILILVVIGAVVIYCVCFSSDKSGPSSKAGGGRGSRNRSKINSGKAGSTMGSKQQSRVSGGAKQQSRIGAKQSSRA